MNIKLLNVLALVAALLLNACVGRDKNGKILDTPTSGMIKIAVDESLKPLIEAEIDTFEGIYQQAHIQAKYMSEAEAVEALLKDSVRMIITTRKLVESELNVFKPMSIVPTQLEIAKDGIAIILNKANPDSLIKINQLKEILEGKINNWNQLSKSSKLPNVEVVFDSPTSGMVRFLNDSLVHMNKLPANCFALNSNKAVVDYVAQKTNAIGLIGTSWISDHDSAANSFLKTIRVASVSRDSDYYKPYQAYLALGDYPLVRKIYTVSREARTGLANGFMTFVASDRGQRIVLKSGLVPVTMPLRIVQINKDQLQ